MRKVIWGYSAKLVDEKLEEYEIQNTKLEKKLLQATEEIGRMKAELEKAEEVSKKLDETKKECEKEKERTEELQNEIDKLREEIKLANEVNLDGDEFEKAGNICRAAYIDMHNMKTETMDMLKDFSDDVANECRGYHERLLELSKQVTKVQKENRERFESFVSEILDFYEKSDCETARFEEKIESFKRVGDDLERRIDKMLEAPKSFKTHKSDMKHDKKANTGSHIKLTPTHVTSAGLRAGSDPQEIIG